MQRVLLSTFGLIAVMASPITAADTLDKQAWRADLDQDFTEMKQEAVADIQQMNMDAIDTRDERVVQRIKQQQEQLVNANCDKTLSGKS
jgi:phosphoserine phosphatase